MNTQRGSDSYLLFALNKDNAPNASIDDLAAVDKLVYNIVSADLARDTEVVVIEESSASGNPQVPEASRIRTQGNVVYNLRGQNMQRILQHALWTKTPISEVVATTKDLLSAQAYVTGTAVAISTQPGEDIEPAKAVVTLASSSFVAGKSEGLVKVVGTDMDDLEVSDTIVFSSATGTERSSEYFKTITSITVVDIEDGTVALSVDNDRKEVRFVLGGSPLFGTVELNRGAAAPIVFDRIIATGFSVAVSGNGAVQLTVNYAGRQAVKKTLEGAVRNGDGLHGLPVEFREVNDSVFLAYGAVVAFGGEVLPIRDMTLNVNRNYDVQGYLTGERPYATPEQNSRVTAVLTGTVKYVYDETYSDTFIQNRFLENFLLKFLRAPSGKAKDEMEFRFGRGKLSTDPDRVSITQGVVEQNIEISLLGSEGATVTDYLTLFVRSSEGLYGEVFVG